MAFARVLSRSSTSKAVSLRVLIHVSETVTFQININGIFEDVAFFVDAVSEGIHIHVFSDVFKNLQQLQHIDFYNNPKLLALSYHHSPLSAALWYH